MEFEVLKKNDCISIEENKYYIHPLLNKIETIEKKTYVTIPQINKNTEIILDTFYENKKLNNLNINGEIIKSSNYNERLDLINVMTFPINSNNFLDIVFNITTISNLSNFINNLDINNKEILDIVFDLFWKNYYNIIDQNLDDFININIKLVKKYFDKVISIDIMTKIINKLIKKNYGKKIKYISKIKKYLDKYNI
jgi:hypothetical protein